ncbi:hypothetical protein GIB67_034871 [Kingdonia uniflora]|uniref:Uncharacterized protein n=1 Tax=Kingdonia uniflora TaxID=39325 RepID=A0A7J7MDZ7_9MAGN|nr:hypothetical protein GIB67_034871 [Kingdonia uniflora]
MKGKERAVEARALNDLCLALKIDEIREAIFGQQGYDAALLETRANYEGMTYVERGEGMNRVCWSESLRICWRSVEDRKEFVMMMAREEIINEDKDIASGLLKAFRVEGHTGCFKYIDVKVKISMVSTSDCAKADEVDLVGRLSPVIRVGNEEDIVAELVEWPRLKGSRVEYPMGCSRFREFCKAKSSVDGIWRHAFGYRAQFDYGLTLPLRNLAKSVMNMIGTCPAQLNYNFWEVILRSNEEPLELSNRAITKGISCKVSRKESLIDSVAKEGTELKVVLKKFGINWFKRVASKDDKVRRSQAKRRIAGKTSGSMEDNMLTPELNTPLKLTRLNQMPDGPIDMATVSSTVVRNLVKRKSVKRGAASRSATSDSVNDSSKRRKFVRALRGVQLGLLDRSIELERWISQLEGEKNKFEESLTREREAFQLELEKEREATTLKLKEVRAESVAEAKRLVSASATSRNNLTGKLYQLRYTKAKILAFREGNYEEKEIVDEEKVEEIEDGLNVAEKTVVDN